MNPEYIDLTRHPMPADYRLANAKDMKRKRAPDGWLFFSCGTWHSCSGLHVQKHWTYLVPITKRKGIK